MAIRKDVDYPGRWSAATTDYPMGEPKNRTTSTSKDGSYLEKKWIQDYEAFFGALLNEASVSPNGSVDTAESSQFFDALRSLSPFETTSNSNGTANVYPNGYCEQGNTLELPTPTGAFNPEVIGTLTYYTTYYLVDLVIPIDPSKFTDTQATLACFNFGSQASEADVSIKVNQTPYPDSDSGNITIAITTTKIGIQPTIHWSSKGFKL
ncbi:hypothetical protein MYOV024v1_p0077 [Vibrio phage PS34B.2]|nr:hypothetical protein MYOV024v1_p0077 [Vibrio phage PS34B.2]